MSPSVASAACAPEIEYRDDRHFLAHVAHVAWRAGGGGPGDLPRSLTLQIERQVHAHGGERTLDVTQIPRHELRAVVERMSIRNAGALARLATEMAITAAGGHGSGAGGLGTELGIALQMLEDLRANADADAIRATLWELRPTWTWVWTSEIADAASWVRNLRWVQQIAGRRSDPLPIAQLLGQFASRRGAAEARARLDSACDAIRRYASITEARRG